MVNPQGLARRAEKGTRDRSPAPAAECRQASRVARCRYKGAFRRRVLPIPSKFITTFVHLKDLSQFEAGTEITPELLREKGMIKRQGPVKLLADGDVTGAYNIKVQRVSSAARSKIEAAGGTVEEQ